MGKQNKKSNFLSDLGRANFRGLRKCRKCGTLNGTRGFSCKNSSCDVVFKLDLASQKSFKDTSKLDSGSCRQIFSVRIRDKGPDFRGFVELESSKLLTKLLSSEDQLFGDIGKCHIEMCIKNTIFIQSTEESNCHHILAAQQCVKEAKTLILRSKSTNLIQIPANMKNELWQLATESPGPLVQRVSKGVMVVKCKVDDHHPLGILHLSFHQCRNRKDGVPRFNCGCQQHKVMAHRHFCIHFYACIMAFASSDQLAKEFSYFINLVISLSNNNMPENPKISIMQTIDLDENCKAEVSEVHINNNEKSFLILNENETDTPCQVEVDVLNDLSDDPLTMAINSPPKCIPKQIESNSKGYNEDNVSWKFSTWLSSVVERINQSMNYGYSGKPDPLVFHIPKHFFTCILERINIHRKRKKCFVERNTFVNTEAMPSGRFTKLTWKLVRLSQVIGVFSSSERTLKTAVYFTQDKHGRYIECEESKPPKIDAALNQGPVVRPHELKTLLNVGVLNPLISKEPLPFIIDWIPDILPQCEIGEMRLKFEFIHCNNNQYVPKVPNVSLIPISIKPNKPNLPALAPKNKLPLPLNTNEVVELPVPHDFSPGDIAILTF